MASKKAANTIQPDNDWQTDSDVRTLTEAEKIKADSKRHGKAKVRAAEMLKQLGNVANPTQDDGDGDDDAAEAGKK